MDELKLREGEPLKLKRGMRIIPLVSVDVPIEMQSEDSESTAKQKTYMRKFTCPKGCLNTRGHVLTVRLTAANATPGVRCNGCGEALAEITAEGETSDG